MQKTPYFTMALTQVKHVGPVLGKKLIEYCGSAEAVFKEKKKNLLNIDGVGTHITTALESKDIFNRVDHELTFIEDKEVGVLSYFDKAYPERLKHCFDAPLILFQQGQIDLQHARQISIVGTRKMTAYGRSFLKNLFANFHLDTPTVISGLAYGVDVYAHRQALEHKLQTVAVLGHGLDRIYPVAHRHIAEQMKAHGGLLTEFWSGTPPDKQNFVRRNRIVAGLSQATLVIESALKGGSLITADFANSYNRDVFALPGRVTDAYSAGCNHLIKTNRAVVLSSVNDLRYLLNWDAVTPTQNKVTQFELFKELPEPEQKIYQYLRNEGQQQLDIIALHCNFPIHKTMSLLLNLELNNLLRRLPGKFYEVI